MLRSVRQIFAGGSGRWRVPAALALLCLAVAGAGAAKFHLDVARTDVAKELSGPSVSKIVLDRNDRLLRAFTAEDRRWRLPVELSNIDPLYLSMLIAFEDKRFQRHSGIDALSMGRAVVQALTNGRIVSGASTLTMQVARLLREAPTRNLAAKYRQLVDAAALEARYEKDEILSLYALRAPFGGNIEGVRAASLIWFGKEPARLTPAQVALLVALPQAPEVRRPDRYPVAARTARDRVLQVAEREGIISQDAYRAAVSEPVPVQRRRMPMIAAHKARGAIAGAPDRGTHRLTIERELQARLEKFAREQAQKLSLAVSLAILVADHQSGEVVAALGSPKLTDETRRGHIDMTTAIRSPGSTLKPLIYALAFEDGIAHPESFIEDRPIDVGGYRPTNFSKAFQGRVTVREALQLSLNVPAVQTLQTVGPAKLMARLKRAGAVPTLPSDVPPGLAIGLGGVGMSLHDLVALYSALARRGRIVPLTLNRDEPVSRRSPLMIEETAAWYVEDILAGTPRPVGVTGTGIAFKTGTSYGYRDSWSVGFDGRHVVGIWVGRPDGSPVPGQMGIKTAAPVMFEVFSRISEERAAFAKTPDGILAAATGTLPIPLRHARVERAGVKISSADELSIVYPPNGAEVDLGLGHESAAMPLVIKSSGGRHPLRWFVNDQPIHTSRLAGKLTWQPSEPGYTSIAVVDRNGNADRITIRLR